MFEGQKTYKGVGFMKLAPLVLGDLVAKIPIIQGGMGVGVSLSNLASAVANEGGIGVISGVQIGFREPDFLTNTLEANERALAKEIRRSRELSPKGIIGVNFLVAMNNYKELVAVAVKEKIDLIISGAGLPMELPKMTKGTDTKIAPIVSSGRAASLIAKMWDRRYQVAPDMVIVEGPKAGGHLGFSKEDLMKNPLPDLKDILVDVINALKPFCEKYKKNIPVVAAGGIYTGSDIAEYIKLGAAGVQMATRFVTTQECDADINFKMAYIHAKEEDITIINSPVGMPGRAIYNEFVKKLEVSNIAIKRCYGCIKTCHPGTSPYCISKALIDAVLGNVKEGLIFTGTNAYMSDKIVKVKDLMQELVAQAEAL